MDIEKWNLILTELHGQYDSAKPFPHVTLDGFLPDTEADAILSEFPTPASDGWIHYRHFNEDKHGLNDMSRLPPAILRYIEFMHSKEVIAFFEKLTGIPDLLPDPTLEGAGIHVSERGGYLNMHADFATHPQVNNLERRLNVLFYVNRNWKPEYRGDLELWNADMTKCEQKIAPLFNRLLVFNTTSISFHGFPEPILCPEGETRKSLALYYYTKSETNKGVMSTSYKTRPGDGLKAVPNWVDNKLLYTYTYLKRVAGLDDKFASKLLNFKRWFTK